MQHARAALAPTRRTVVSLRRLPAPASTRPQLHALIASERSLQAAYAALAGGRKGPAAGQLRDRERQATARALAVGLPGCAEPGA
jgi:hypothetical protein